jgi:hypothetical protein
VQEGDVLDTPGLRAEGEEGQLTVIIASFVANSRLLGPFLGEGRKG